MAPRPILLVEDPTATGLVMHPDCEQAIVRAGYLVIRTPPGNLGMLRVVAPCPFVDADVAALREAAEAESRAGNVDQSVALDSIADRIAGLLAFEAKRA